MALCRFVTLTFETRNLNPETRDHPLCRPCQVSGFRFQLRSSLATCHCSFTRLSVPRHSSRVERERLLPVVFHADDGAALYCFRLITSPLVPSCSFAPWETERRCMTTPF